MRNALLLLTLFLLGVANGNGQEKGQQSETQSASQSAGNRIEFAFSIPGPGPLRTDTDLSTPGAVCQLHKVKMSIGRAKITYGYPADPKPAEVKYRGDHFPNANSSTPGDGCVVNNAMLWAKVSYCPECRKVERIYNEKRSREFEKLLNDLRSKAILKAQLREDSKVFGLPQDR
jgi:hypothetical protein